MLPIGAMRAPKEVNTNYQFQSQYVFTSMVNSERSVKVEDSNQIFDIPEAHIILKAVNFTNEQ